MSEARPLVLGIVGSPRAKSNTGALLERVLAGAAAAGAQTELVVLRKLNYESCRHCGGCDKTGRCVVEDDILELHANLRGAQHLVLASPIHFSGVSGEMKAMMDRAQAFWVARYRLKAPVSDVGGERRGVFVATCGGGDRRVFEWARHSVLAFFNSTGFSYWGDLFEAKTDKPPLSERGEVLAAAWELGREVMTVTTNTTTCA